MIADPTDTGKKAPAPKGAGAFAALSPSRLDRAAAAVPKRARGCRDLTFPRLDGMLKRNTDREERRGHTMYRVFIVEDDGAIAGVIRRHLAGWGYDVRCAERFDDVLSEFAAFSPHLVLLDISLPFFNGYHWCREIRRVSKVPILFLTSAGDSVNTVMAMQMGGDDLLAKPFDLQVLSAKVQAMLRRAYDFGPSAQLLSCGGAVLNVSDGTLDAAGQRVELTRNELRILQMLLERKGQTVSREALMTRLWESDSFVDENTLTVNIARLRRKLEAAGLPDFIRTRKGAGYLVEG